MKKLFRLLAAVFLLTAFSVPYQNGNVPVTAGQHRILSYIAGVDFSISGDQSFPIDPRTTRFLVTGIYVANCSAAISFTGAIYTAPNAGGFALITAQAYNLTAGTNKVTSAPLATGVNTTIGVGLSSLYLHITITNATSATCDIFIDGIDLTPF